MQNAKSIAFTAAVLAGGRSSRMGTDKALLRWEGQTLVQRQLSLLRTLGPTQVFISGKPAVNYEVADAPVVLDAVPEQGPLGGIEAVLSATAASHVLVLAVDMPGMTAAFLKRLLASCRHGVGAVPRTLNGWEPLAAVYPRELLPLIRTRLTTRQLSLQGTVDAAASAGLVVPVGIDDADAALFRNLNEPRDL